VGPNEGGLPVCISRELLSIGFSKEIGSFGLLSSLLEEVGLDYSSFPCIVLGIVLSSC